LEILNLFKLSIMNGSLMEGLFVKQEDTRLPKWISFRDSASSFEAIIHKNKSEAKRFALENPFQPTPQNMAKLFCDFIYNTFKNNLSFKIVNWIRVDFYDTPVSKSTFTKHIN
jgi:hypothetical protein